MHSKGSQDDQRILITGGCGFVGSSLAIKLKADHPGSVIIAFDNLKRRGSELNIPRLREHGVEFVHGDIRNKEELMQVGPVDVIIEAAAEPSVLAGIDSGPDYVINTNLNGTINCLDLAVKHKAKFIFLSTSRVYPIAALNRIACTEEPTRFFIAPEQTMKGVSEKGISEDFPLEGARSFYGSSKLASEMFIQEYAEFYGLKAVINRCGVIAGPWQMGKIDQGVVVLWMAKHFWKGELSYIGFGGEGKQLRDMLHIDDLYTLVKMQMNDMGKYSGKIYNAGGGTFSSASLKELTAICEELTGNRINIKGVKKNRSADIPVYVTDNSRITADSGWSPVRTPNDILRDVYSWIRKNEMSVKALLS